MLVGIDVIDQSQCRADLAEELLEFPAIGRFKT